MQGDELLLRQNFPLNLPPNRRLCSTVGGRIVEGGTAHCCVVSAARSRAATMTNLARSSLALVLPALFGAAKSCALVKFFMICPRWSPSRQPTTNQILLLITAISWHLCEHVEGDSRAGSHSRAARGKLPPLRPQFGWITGNLCDFSSATVSWCPVATRHFSTQ